MTTDVNNSEIPPENATPAWYIDDGIPGSGNRPDWLPEKFKSVAHLAKSYTELEKKVGTAPEDYDLTKSRYLDPDYVPFLELKQLAKDKRVPKEVMDKMVESVDKYMDEFTPDYSGEVKKLGDNAKGRIEILDNWAKANLSENSYEALTSNLKTADAIVALEELRGKMMSNTPQVPNGNENAGGGQTSLDEIKKELANNLDKYKKDEGYRKDIQGRLEVAAKNEPGYVDKVGA